MVVTVRAIFVAVISNFLSAVVPVRRLVLYGCLPFLEFGCVFAETFFAFLAGKCLTPMSATFLNLSMTLFVAFTISND